MLQTLKATVAGLWLLAATASNSTYAASNIEEFTLGEPTLPINSDLLACAVSINEVSDLILQSGIDIKSEKGRQNKKEATEWFNKVMGDRTKDRKGMNSQSPLLRYREIGAHLLLIASKDDKTVDVSNSQKLHKVMSQAGMDVQYNEYEQGGHSLTSAGTMRRMLAETEAFFYEHIGKTEVN